MKMKMFFMIAYLAIFGGAIGALAKISLLAFSPLTTIFLRVAISLVFFTTIFAYQKRLPELFRNIINHRKKFLLLAISGIGGAMIISFIGLKYTTAIHYDLIFNLSSIFILFFAAILLKEKIRGRDLALVILALAGVALIITEGEISLNALSGGNLFGDLLILTAAAGWALYSVLGIKISRQLPQIDSLTLTFGSFLVAAVLLCPFVLIQRDLGINVSALDARTISAIITLAIFSTGILFFLWFKFINEKGGAWAALVSLSENVGGVILPILLLGEKLTLYTILGGSLITIAVIFKELLERNHQHPPEIL